MTHLIRLITFVQVWIAKFWMWVAIARKNLPVWTGGLCVCRQLIFHKGTLVTPSYIMLNVDNYKWLSVGFTKELSLNHRKLHVIYKKHNRQCYNHTCNLKIKELPLKIYLLPLIFLTVKLTIKLFPKSKKNDHIQRYLKKL